MESEFQTEPKIFIGGLSKEINREVMLDYLGRFGPVDFLNIVRQKDTKKRLGFAFARFKTKIGTKRLLSQNCHQIKNRKLEIQLAKERHEKKDYTEDLKTRKIFIKGLPINIDQKKLEEFFSNMASIRSAYSITEPGGNVGKGYGFVVFKNSKDAQEVLKVKNFEFFGKTITCLPFKTKPEQRLHPDNPKKKIEKVKTQFHDYESSHRVIKGKTEQYLVGGQIPNLHGLYPYPAFHSPNRSSKLQKAPQNVFKQQLSDPESAQSKGYQKKKNLVYTNSKSFEYFPSQMESQTEEYEYQVPNGRTIKLEFIRMRGNSE